MSDSDDSHVDVDTKKTREVKSLDGYYLDPVTSAEDKAEALKQSEERRAEKRRERKSTVTATFHGPGTRITRFSRNSRRMSSGGRLVRVGSMAPMFEPTFRLDAIRPLSQYRLNKILRQTIVLAIEQRAQIKYQPKQMLNFCQTLSFRICFSLMMKRRDRYRIVVIVTIVEKQNPSVCSRMGFLWDIERDLYANFTYETY